MDHVLTVDTPIYSIDVSPDGELLALVQPAPAGLAVTVREFHEPTTIRVRHVFEGVQDTTSVVRFTAAGNAFVLAAHGTLALVSATDRSRVELATDVLVSSVSEDGKWIGGVVDVGGSSAVRRWRATAPDTSRRVELDRVSPTALAEGAATFFERGSYSLISGDEQLIVVDWNQGQYTCHPFSYSGAHWLSMNRQSSLFGIIGNHLTGIGLFTWPEREPHLPQVFSRQARGYTRLLLDGPGSFAALSSQTGYVAFFDVSDGQRALSRQVHDGRVRDMIVDRGELLTCADDGRIVRLSNDDV